jgi:hypothetical protein
MRNPITNLLLTSATLAVAVGCAATTMKIVTLKAGAPQVDCLKLMEQRDDAALAGKILAGVGGISALVTPPIEMEDEQTEKNVRWGVGASAAVTAIVGVSLIWWSDNKGKELETLCEVREVPTFSITDADGGV